VRRASVGHEHYTLAAFCIADKWQWLRGVPLQAIERQLQSFSDAQKRFILEVSLISYFYRQSVEHMPGEILQSSSYSLMASVVHIIETCIDVNRPTPRRDCRLDYSMWQFYLLWLHDYLHGKVYGFVQRIADSRIKAGTAIIPFRAFLEHGADPFAVIASEDLYVCYVQKPGTKRPEFMSVTDILEDLSTKYTRGDPGRKTAVSGFVEILSDAIERWNVESQHIQPPPSPELAMPGRFPS